MPRVGPALVVGRMALSSDLVKRGGKGKALVLLHAWKDELWKMGGEGRPPRPQLLQGSPNGEEYIDNSVEVAAVLQQRTSGNGGTPKEPSQQGGYLRRMNGSCR